MINDLGRFYDHGLSSPMVGYVELAGIEPVGVMAHVLDEFREANLSGRLPRGERVVESRLSRQMRVGQNTMREVQLEFQGLVVRVANNGTLVTDFSLEDINQIYRFWTEWGGAVQLAREAGRPGPEAVCKLERAL